MCLYEYGQVYVPSDPLGGDSLYPWKAIVPIYGLGFGVAPYLNINGTLAGQIDGPGIHSSFELSSNSTDLGFQVPQMQRSEIAELAPITVHNLVYNFSPDLKFRVFVWGFIMNPKALLNQFKAPAGEPTYLEKTVDLVDIPVKIPTQSFIDERGFQLTIPISLMDKDPLVLDGAKVLLVGVVVSLAVITAVVRRPS